MAWSHVTGYKAHGTRTDGSGTLRHDTGGQAIEEGSNGCSKRQEAMNIEHRVKTASLQAARLLIDGDAFCLNPET